MEFGGGIVTSHHGPQQNAPGNTGQQQDNPVKGRGDRLKMAFTHIGRGKREKGQPEQQMKVHPKDPAVDLLCSMHQMMMVVPINAQINKTQYISDQGRKHAVEIFKTLPFRYFYLQYHDRDYYGQNSIAKGFQTIG